MKTILKLTLLIIPISIFGCAGSRPLPTPSGKPEVTIQNVSKKEVTDALVNEMLSRGFTIKNVTDYTVVFAKPLDSFTAIALFGSQYDATPEHRPTFMLVQSATDVRLVLTNLIITNPGSAFERVTDASTGKAGQSWQDFLNSFSDQFRLRGRVGMTVDEKGFVISMVDSAPAMRAGIAKGDKMITVDGVPYSGTNQIKGEPGTTVTLVILRDGKQLSFTITREILK